MRKTCVFQKIFFIDRTYTAVPNLLHNNLKPFTAATLAI